MISSVILNFNIRNTLKTFFMSKLDVNKLFETFESQNIIIVGDVMVDAYLFGKVERISPEAPVPVVAVTHRDNRPGGAANVAVNIKSMGAVPHLCSVVGNDEKGQAFIDILKNHKMSVEGIVVDNERITTTKFRIIGNNSQMLRVDEEQNSLLSDETTDKLYLKVKNLIETKDISCLIFQDYDKGVLTADIIHKISDLANTYQIPIAVDPKKRNFFEYKNVQLYKPNLKEFCEGVKIENKFLDFEDLKIQMQKFQKEQNIDKMMVTLSEKGILLNFNSLSDYSSVHCPAHLRKIADVSGAGDTVIAVAAMCLAAGLSDKQLTEISNLSGGLVCQYLGVVPIDKNELLEETIKLDL